MRPATPGPWPQFDPVTNVLLGGPDAVIAGSRQDILQQGRVDRSESQP
jgi:hypothetical protein